MSASGIDYEILLVSGSNCKLVEWGILGNNLGFVGRFGSQVTSNHLTSWTCSHSPAGTNVAMDEFFPKLEIMLFMFNMGTFSVFGVL